MPRASRSPRRTKYIEMMGQRQSSVVADCRCCCGGVAAWRRLFSKLASLWRVAVGRCALAAPAHQLFKCSRRSICPLTRTDLSLRGHCELFLGFLRPRRLLCSCSPIFVVFQFRSNHRLVHILYSRYRTSYLRCMESCRHW